jgi:hypothetical protein
LIQLVLGDVYYFTAGGHRVNVKLSATLLPNLEARAAGHQIFDGKKGAAIHINDKAAQNTEA